MLQNLVIFASGKPDSGGTGAENLVRQLPGRTLAIVSSHENGGVRKRAYTLRVPFFYFPGPCTEEGYRDFIRGLCQKLEVRETDLWYALSGWFKMVYGLDPARTFNIHSAPLPRFAGMYDEKLHRAVWDAYCDGEIDASEICMHFATSKCDDEQAIFFRVPVPLHGIVDFRGFERVTHKIEHLYQPRITRMVIDGEISWDGMLPESLKVPEHYQYL